MEHTQGADSHLSPIAHISDHLLFARAYLRDLLAAPASAAIHACRQTIKEWRDSYPSLDDPDDCRSYIGQCLSSLGLSYQRRADGFTLYADDTLAQPVGLCLHVTDADIGRATKGRHYQAMLVRELRQASLSWGMITNGQAWRLCHAASPAPYEAYVQADLDALLDDRSVASFSLFCQLCGHDAFAVTTQPRDLSPRSGLDRRLAASEQRVEVVQRYLRSRVEPVLQSLCLGFVQDEAAATYSRQQLDDIYRNAIYLLYRILFVFYAEARDLLPTTNAGYRAIGLSSILDATRLRQQGVQDADPHSLWKRLTNLFVIVDDGDAALGISPYDGGLFSDTEKTYLKIHKIADYYLAPALFELGYMQNKSGAEPIDYRDLSVRHLGTLYEGLLEYRLNLVDREPVVVRESGGKRVYIPQSQAGPIKRTETILPIGQVYFADDKGERKSSGSYYTPEDVVQYIVTHTVKPKVEERCASLTALLDQARRERAIAPTVAERARIEHYADQKTIETVQREILSLRVLDPAMGSAHFLVAAGQIITNAIVETLNATDWPNDAISTDPVLWKRRVVERCLYGVDINPLAQELAKLALWLTSASAGKPLTFLDHHLKCGNSLYGAPLARLSSLPTPNGRNVASTRTEAETAGTSDLFTYVRESAIRSVLSDLSRITAVDSDDITVVKDKAEANRTVSAYTQRLRDLANVWLATFFGLADSQGQPLDADAYAHLVELTAQNHDPASWESIVRGDWALRRARQIAEAERFFHWELEFPDAVANGSCQFDAVVANPPYVGTSPDQAIMALYQAAKCGDRYAWMLERAIDLLGNNGGVGTIVPLSLMFAGDKRPLRQKLMTERGELRLISCDNNPDAIFEAPGSARNRQRTTILVLNRTSSSLVIRTTDYLRWLRSERSLLFDHLRFADTTQLVMPAYFCSIGDARLVTFLRHARAGGHTLGDLVSNRGEHVLCVQSAACYFVSAVLVDLRRRNQEMLSFDTQRLRNAAFALINSNVFYWYWRSRSDGFWVSREQILGMPIPSPDVLNGPLLALAERLWTRASECAVRQNFNGKMVTTYYFNRCMDILLDIDDWIVQHVAPDLNLPRDIFAQYKSNSFLRPLNLSELMQASAEPEEDA